MRAPYVMLIMDDIPVRQFWPSVVDR